MSGVGDRGEKTILRILRAWTFSHSLDPRRSWRVLSVAATEAETSRANTLSPNRLITSIFSRRLTGFWVGVTARSRNKTCCLGEGNRRGTSIETEGQRLRAGSGEGAAQGYAIEAVTIPLSGSVAGFAGDIGAVLTRQDILINVQCGPSRRGRTGPTRGDR
jgi:hypothetical protein